MIEPHGLLSVLKIARNNIRLKFAQTVQCIVSALVIRTGNFFWGGGQILRIGQAMQKRIKIHMHCIPNDDSCVISDLIKQSNKKRACESRANAPDKQGEAPLEFLGAKETQARLEIESSPEPCRRLAPKAQSVQAQITGAQSRTLTSRCTCKRKERTSKNNNTHSCRPVHNHVTRSAAAGSQVM